MNSGARLTALKTNAVDAVFYNSQYTYDNKEFDEILSKDDLPDEVIITEPYYTSRIYEVDSSKKLDELVAKGIISSQERTQTEIEGATKTSEKAKNEETLIVGELAQAASSEEDVNNLMKQWGLNVNAKFFNNLSLMMLALKSGKIDFITLLPKSTAEYIKERNDDIVLYKSPETDGVKYSMATLVENKEVYEILNNTLKGIISDGTIKTLQSKYIDAFITDVNDPKIVEMPHFDGAKIIKVAVTGDLPPFDFVSVDGNPAGYNAALLSEIANRAKVNIELVPMDEVAKVTALFTKNVDAIFWICNFKYTDERNIMYDYPEGTVLTDCYYEDDAYIVCQKGGKYDKRRNGSK